MFGTGAGAAWLWQGGSREALTPATVHEMSGFLSTAYPRLRVLGGTRFNTAQEPQPEWAEFGAYCFMLPRSAVVPAPPLAQVCTAIFAKLRPQPFRLHVLSWLEFVLSDTCCARLQGLLSQAVDPVPDSTASASLTAVQAGVARSCNLHPAVL